MTTSQILADMPSDLQTRIHRLLRDGTINAVAVSVIADMWAAGRYAGVGEMVVQWEDEE